MTTSSSSTPSNASRMDEEFRRLTAANYQVKMRPGDTEYYFTVRDARLPEIGIYLVAPANYPTQPPDVLIARNGQRVDIDQSTVLRDWQTNPAGETYLVDVVDDLVPMLIALPPEQQASAVPPASPVPGATAGAYGAYDSAAAYPSTSPTGAYDYGYSGIPTEPEAEQSGPTQLQRIFVTVGVVLFAVALGILLWLFFQPGQNQVAIDYADIWARVDTVQTNPSPTEEELLQAIDGLNQVLATDPNGNQFARNAEVVPTLTQLYVRLGDFYLNQEPPNLDAAESSYLSALELTPNDPSAIAGRERVAQIRTEESVNEVIDQSTEEVWAQIDASTNPADQVRLIESLQLLGVPTDRNGVPTATRLYEARMDLARQQLNDRFYNEARATAEAARNGAPDDAARQDATNLLAQIYLAQGQSELEQGRLPTARNAFNSVLQINNPAPSQDLINQANQGIAEVDNAETQLSNLQKVELGWQSYDAAVGRQDWNSAIVALDTVIAITGPTPERADFPSPPYNPRTYDVMEIQSQVRLKEAEQLQIAGNFSAAQAQYDAVRFGFGRISDQTRQQAEQGVLNLTQAQVLWNQTNAALANSDWEGALVPLRELENLDGFGPEARNPQGGQTVASLIELAESRLDKETPTPGPAATATPTSAPAATPTSPPAATAEPTTAPTDAPTTEPLPTDTPTLEPTSTPTTEPTATPTTEPTNTPTTEPTATPTPEPTVETYTFPSGLFSVDVLNNWTIDDRSVAGSGRAEVNFASPDDADEQLTIYIEELPAPPAPRDADSLEEDFIERTFTPDEAARIGVEVQIDGDKVSFLVVPNANNVSSRLQAVIDSYDIDPNIDLP